MKITIVGYGWVGQANAIALVRMGHNVRYFDPYETELHYSPEFGDEYNKVARLSGVLDEDGESTCYMVCVGDRVSSDGVQDIVPIEAALKSVSGAKGTVILRSTVLPEKLSGLDFDFYMPEFLHEKNAVAECIEPHFFVLGRKSDVQEPAFFGEWEKSARKTFRGTPEEASYVKYLSNIWNAVRIAFVNEFGDSIREPASAEDVRSIERVLDFVLGSEMYLRYGRAFQGHCLPKDMRAYVRSRKDKGMNVPLLVGAYEANELHVALQKHYSDMPTWFSTWKGK